jgi:copper homeostasis protein (lipoprotein)
MAAGLALVLPSWAAALVVEGTAAYRERIAMPPDAVFEARVEDVSRADAPSVLLGRHRIEHAGNPPYRFRIEIDDAALKPTGRYAVRATVRVGERLVFTTDTFTPIAPGAAAAPLNLLLVSARGSGGGAAPRGPTALQRLPASFIGDLPAAGGGPVRWQIDLLPGQRFQSRQTFVGRPEPNRFDDVGLWRYDRAANKLELRGARETRLRFEPDGPALRMLDAQGQRIVSASGLNDRLERQPQAVPIEPRIVATGMFTYYADAASIVLCADGRRLPVAMQGDYLALERAYSAAIAADRAQPGQALLVSFDGTIAPRPSAEESQPPRPTLVVERFGKVWPRETCGTPMADSPLRNTYWKLVRLNGEPTRAFANQREAHLIFNAKEPRVAGSDGCNRVTGSFEVDGDQLRLSRTAGTMMACPGDGAAQERAFLDALGKAATWQVRGSHLELFDAQRQVLARFEAVALR